MSIFFYFIAAFMALIALAIVARPLLMTKKENGREVQSDRLNLDVLRDQLRELEQDLAAGTIDPTAYESAKRDLEQRVATEFQPHDSGTTTASDKSNSRRLWQVGAMGLLLLIAPFVVYRYLGAPYMLTPIPTGADSANSQTPHATGQTEALALVARLAERMVQHPDDPEGWLLLARSYSSMNSFAAASQAYERLFALIPDDAKILADYADVLAMTQNQRIQGKPEELLRRALVVEPNNVKALILLGDAEYERNQLPEAISRWKAAIAAAPAGSQFIAMAQSNIDHVEKELADRGLAKPTTGAASQAASDKPTMSPDTKTAPNKNAASSPALAAGKISGRVELDPSLIGKLTPTDTVFIYARAVDGPRFPLAILRKQVKDLPLDFVLDDSMGMVPSTKLSDFPTLIVGARVSLSGNATPSAGDWEGVLDSVPNGSTGLKLKISSQRR